jgi:hypothetical protein
MNDLVRNPQAAMTRAVDARHELAMQRDRQAIERGLELAKVPAAMAASRIPAGALATKLAMVEAASVINLQLALTEQLPAGAPVFEQIADAFGFYACAEIRCLAEKI